MDRSRSSSISLWMSSRSSRSSARSPSLCTSTSCVRSCALIFSWYLRFSRLNTSSACMAKMSRSRRTSSFMTSWSTKAFSLSATAPLTCRTAISTSSFSVRMLSSILALSALSAALALWTCSRSSSLCLTCSSSMECSALTFSSTPVSLEMRAFRALTSSSLRTPPARATLRSICCSWNSTLYSSSCCFTTCSSSEEMRLDRFLFWPWPPLISLIMSRSLVRSSKSLCDLLNCSFLRSSASLMTDFKWASSALRNTSSSSTLDPRVSRVANSLSILRRSNMYLERAASRRLRCRSSAMRAPSFSAVQFPSSVAVLARVARIASTWLLSSSSLRISRRYRSRCLPISRS
mmetsp:Transcript_6019/g.16025  ORF Transcript_6019/g.16025 Transcript_6019/m.16025 type:complete len:348 (-) Transcript_6019:1047-2090(-)